MIRGKEYDKKDRLLKRLGNIKDANEKKNVLNQTKLKKHIKLLKKMKDKYFDMLVHLELNIDYTKSISSIWQ